MIEESKAWNIARMFFHELKEGLPVLLEEGVSFVGEYAQGRNLQGILLGLEILPE